MNIDLNKAVFTTKFVLEDRSPVMYVSHDLEGDWQFFGKEDHVKEADARITSLGEMLELCPSLTEILWIPQGMQAWHNDETNQWESALSKASSG